MFGQEPKAIVRELIEVCVLEGDNFAIPVHKVFYYFDPESGSSIARTSSLESVDTKPAPRPHGLLQIDIRDHPLFCFNTGLEVSVDQSGPRGGRLFLDFQSYDDAIYFLRTTIESLEDARDKNAELG